MTSQYRMHALGLLLISTVLLVGCDGGTYKGIGPTVIADVNASPDKLANGHVFPPVVNGPGAHPGLYPTGMESPGAWFDDTQLGHAKRTNLGTETAGYYFLLVDRSNPGNQRIVAHTPTATMIAPTKEADFTLGLKPDHCKKMTVQRDFAKNVPFPITDGTTWNEVQNYIDAADSRPWDVNPESDCTPPPHTPTCEELGNCSPHVPTCEELGNCEPIKQCRAGFTLTDFVTPILAQGAEPTYPNATPVLPFSAPAGWPLIVTMVTTDDHTKPGEAAQLQESVRVLYASAGAVYEGASPATDDVPDLGTTTDTAVTQDGITFAHDITNVQIQHAGPLSLEPTNSVRLVSLSVRCADGAQAQRVRR